MLPNQAARLDAWIASQPDKPRQAEAIRRLIDIALGVAPGNLSGPPPTPAPPPTPIAASAPPPSPMFQLGDRVESQKFGTGRVWLQPRLCAGTDQPLSDGATNIGYEVGVRWDRGEWGIIWVEECALELLFRAPDADASR